jgi:hypothetical protein
MQYVFDHDLAAHHGRVASPISPRAATARLHAPYMYDTLDYDESHSGHYSASPATISSTRNHPRHDLDDQVDLDAELAALQSQNPLEQLRVLRRLRSAGL